MGTQVVHKNGHLVWASLLSQLHEVLNKSRSVHGLQKYFEMFRAIFLANCRDHSQGWFIEPSLIDLEILLGPRPFFVLDCLPCEHGLVEIDHSVAVVLGPRQLLFHRCKELLRCLRRQAFGLLVPSELLFLDAVHSINLPKQCSIHFCSWKLFLEKRASSHQRDGHLLTKRGTAYHPRNLVLLEEADAKVLSRLFGCDQSQSLQ